MTVTTVADPATPEAFKLAMRGVAGACSLITVGHGDRATGLVVTSGVSLTADPPMVLACINRSSSSWPILQAEGAFGWSSLGAGDQGVAERFSGFGGFHGPARYDGAEWVKMPGGTQVLADAPLSFDCAVEEMLDRGTHSILIGRVRAIRTAPGRGALLYWAGRYVPLAA